jgi:hypothetical protein
MAEARNKDSRRTSIDMLKTGLLGATFCGLLGPTIGALIVIGTVGPWFGRYHVNAEQADDLRRVIFAYGYFWMGVPGLILGALAACILRVHSRVSHPLRLFFEGIVLGAFFGGMVPVVSYAFGFAYRSLLCSPGSSVADTGLRWRIQRGFPGPSWDFCRALTTLQFPEVIIFIFLGAITGAICMFLVGFVLRGVGLLFVPVPSPLKLNTQNA